ncbi:MAG: hypothetical protein H6978_07305 [Gammaproteobacteria bacterium]|nr:hypothetical protein [Gammaproteobacteria bacterium]
MNIKPLMITVTLIAGGLTLAACQRAGEPAAPTAVAATSPAPFILTASIHDIMKSIVDPSADYLWDSVSMHSSANGVVYNKPETDEDWQAVRDKAITLLEATNLLEMEGRHVVNAGQHLEDEGADGNLTAEQIQALIDDSHERFTSFAQSLHEATLHVLNAIDARDVDGLFDRGGDIDTACEACHVVYWYPGQGIPGIAPVADR